MWKGLQRQNQMWYAHDWIFLDLKENLALSSTPLRIICSLIETRALITGANSRVRKATGQWWTKRQVNRQLIKKHKEEPVGIKEEMWMQEVQQSITNHSQWSHSHRFQGWMEGGQSSPSQRHQVNRGWSKSYSCREGSCLVAEGL